MVELVSTIIFPRGDGEMVKPKTLEELLALDPKKFHNLTTYKEHII